MPTLFPQLLANGTTGIAVGMACSFAPHRVLDVYKACDKIIEECLNNNYDVNEDEIIDIIQGPDFPTGGIIINPQEVRKAYKTGKGKIIIRGKYNIETIKDKSSIVFTEIPYKINKSSLMNQLDELRKNTLTEIKEIRDESNKDGIRIVIELKKGINTDWILQNLFKKTVLQSNYPINHTAIVDGKPKEGIKLLELLFSFIDFCVQVVKNKTKFNLDKFIERKNIVDGILIALDNLDRIIEIIKTEDSDQSIINTFNKEFKLNEVQSKNIINTRLGTLKKVSVNKLKTEQNDLFCRINMLNDILNDKNLLLKETKNSLQETSELFKHDPRRTEIKQNVNLTVSDRRDLVKEEKIIITLTSNGVIKSVKETEYNTQHRNGTGIKNKIKEEDTVYKVMHLTTKDDILLFTNTGYCYILPAYTIPITKNNGNGKYLSNFVDLDEQTYIVDTMVATKKDVNKHIMLFTKNGLVKRMLSETVKSRFNKIKVMTLLDNDEITSVLFVTEEDNIALFTKNGQVALFKVNAIRASGRASQGVKGIKLKDNDILVSALVYNEQSSCFIVTEQGIGKRLPMSLLSLKNRGSQGILGIKLDKNNYVAQVSSCTENNDILITTLNGQTIRIKASSVGELGRNSKGVKLMRLNDNDQIIGFSVLEREEETDE